MLGIYQAHLSQNYATRLLNSSLNLKFKEFLNELIYINIACSDREKRLNALKLNIRQKLRGQVKKKKEKIEPIVEIHSINERIGKLDEAFWAFKAEIMLQALGAKSNGANQPRPSIGKLAFKER